MNNLDNDREKKNCRKDSILFRNFLKYLNWQTTIKMQNREDLNDDDNDNDEKKTWTYYVKLVLIIIMVVIIVGVTIAFLIPNSPVKEPMLQAIEWLQNQPTWTKGLLMVGLFLIALPIGIPSTPLELCSGFIFGWLWGSIFAMIGASLSFLFLHSNKKNILSNRRINRKAIGAILCFWWGKLLLIEWSEKQQRKKKIVRAICYAVRKEALKLVVLCRLSPVLPSSIMNYLFATTGFFLLLLYFIAYNFDQCLICIIIR